jgi:hypothetical protein
MDLSPELVAAGFHVEVQRLRYVKGWPEKSPKPFRLYRHGKFLAAFPNRHRAFLNALSRI